MNGVSDQIRPKIGFYPASNIVIANMIGAGIFTTSGLLMSGLDNPLLLIILWFTGGIIALCGALAYAELGAAMPRAGGEYIFLANLYHPVVGFSSGWVSFVAGFSAPIAASAIGFSEYIFRIFHGSPFAGKVLAVSIILLFTLIHLRGMRFGSKVQNLLTLLKIGLIILLITTGILLGNGDTGHFRQGNNFSFDFNGLKTIGLSLMWIMFAYSGWNASTYIGSEIENPTRNIPHSLLFGTGVVMILYVLLNVVYVYAISPEEMKGVIAIGGLAVRNLFGNNMEIAFSLIIAFALFSSLSAYIILGPRVYYAMAADGYFFRFVSRTNPRTNAPAGAIILQSAIAMVMVITGTFDQILTYMGFALGFFPILAVAGVFKLRKKLNKTGIPLHLPVYLLFTLIMLILSFLERPLESSIALLTILSGLPVFYLFKKRSSKQHSI
ncbi:MAG TPA: amino acid permease [Bacteroidales bacterium]|jgi:APA family basic amino acid/polyamine antiporter|nr:amino acid permease [Bacteroidales bacterium]